MAGVWQGCGINRGCSFVSNNLIEKLNSEILDVMGGEGDIKNSPLLLSLLFLQQGGCSGRHIMCLWAAEKG